MMQPSPPPLRHWVAMYNGRRIKVWQISAFTAIRTAAKVFRVKMNKVSVREI